MTTYQQDLTVYVATGERGFGNGGRYLLTPLYCWIRERAPNSSLWFRGTGAQANVLLTFPSDYVMRSSAVLDASDSHQGRNADALFRKGNVITIGCNDFSLYANASYLIERNRIRDTWGLTPP